MKIRIECPDGRTLESRLRELGKYLEAQTPAEYQAALKCGEPKHEAERHAREWANAVLEGALSRWAVRCFIDGDSLPLE